MKRKETVRELTILIDRLRSQERSIQAQIRSVEETLKLYSNEAPIDVVLQPDDKTTVRLWPPEKTWSCDWMCKEPTPFAGYARKRF